MQTVYTYQEEAKKVLNKEDVDQCIHYYQYGSNDETTYQKIQIICQKWYDEIMRSTGDQNVKNFFLENMVFFDSLDGKFNSLRYMEYNSNAKKVINAYSIVFIFMLKSLYKIPYNFSWKYENIFQLINQNYDNLEEKADDSYYAILKRHKIKHNIVTTNYTNLAKQITGQDVVHLHGKLNWFEDLHHLMIYDCLYEDERNKAILNEKHLLPFILIPSGVKPLICKREIEQFNQFIHMLDESDNLCVIGYRFNSEDNHVNSIIADWLAGDFKHQLTYFAYENGTVNFSEMTWSKDFDFQINIKPITESNCHKEFENFLLQFND